MKSEWVCHKPISGYLAVTLLITENTEFIKLIISSIKDDLNSARETDNCLALCALGNMGGKEFAEAFAEPVLRLLESSKRPFVRKKAALCLLRLYRKYPECVNLKDWSKSILLLMNDPDLGVKFASTSLILVCAQNYPEEYSACVDAAISNLSSIVISKDFKQEYVYYKIPAPWLQVKLLRLLQYYPEISKFLFLRSENPKSKSELERVINSILVANQDIPKNIQQANAQHAILFEAINLAIHLDAQSDLVLKSTELLSKFISAKETNLRYLGLDALAHLAASVDSLDILKQQHFETILVSLNDKDISVRRFFYSNSRRALDLMYSMCDLSNSKLIVKELLQYLLIAEYAIRDELVLKIAILTEKFSTDSTWYVDVMLQLIIGAGEQISDDVWHRVVQIISNDESIQAYAARSVMNSIQDLSSHENIVNVGAYILGEYGHLIAEEVGYQPIDQLNALQQRFRSCNLSTKSLLLTTMLKFANLFPEIKPNVVLIFDQYRQVLDVELQQRACEYHAIVTLPTTDILETLCDAIPPFAPRESALLQRLQSKLTDTEDKRTWLIGGKWDEKKTSPSRGSPTRSVGGSPLDPVADKAKLLHRLLQTSSGILFEDDLLQIGVKSEYHRQLGRVGVYFGNKSSFALENFSVRCDSRSTALKITIIQPLDPVIQAQKQECLLYNVECQASFSEIPTLFVEYFKEGSPTTLDLSLPIVLTKFFEPVVLEPEDFFSRWRMIGGAPLENVLIFASHFNESDLPKLLKNCNFEVLTGIDPNVSNAVAAGIFNCTTLGKVGCLLRIESTEETEKVWSLFNM